MLKSSCGKAAAAPRAKSPSALAKPCTSSRKTRTFFSLEMDVQLMRLVVEHNPYQLGKAQWDFVLTAMKEIFNVDFLLRTLKERTSKLVEKYSQEQLTYKTGTEEQVSELGNLLEQVVGYIDASSVPINQQSSADAFPSGDEEEENNPPVTPCAPRTTNTARRTEKLLADMERDELLNHSDDVAPGPKTIRKKRGSLCPEDELIKKKQEQDFELETKRLKLEEKKMEYDFEIQRQKLQLEQERLTLEKEKTRIAEEEHKRRDAQQNTQTQLMQQMHEVVIMLINKSKSE